VTPDWKRHLVAPGPVSPGINNHRKNQMNNLIIPASIDEAVSNLNGIEALLTAKGWERAAIVAAFVRLGEHGVSPAKATSSLSTHEFAALGIAGLKSKDTVRTYVQRWLDANNGKHPKPGSKVKLPASPWETVNMTSPNTPTRVRSAIAKDPAKLAAVTQQAVETVGLEAVLDAVSQGTSSSVSELGESFDGQTGIEDVLRVKREMGRLEASMRRLSIDLRERPDAFDERLFERLAIALDMGHALLAIAKGVSDDDIARLLEGSNR